VPGRLVHACSHRQRTSSEKDHDVLLGRLTRMGYKSGSVSGLMMMVMMMMINHTVQCDRFASPASATIVLYGTWHSRHEWRCVPSYFNTPLPVARFDTLSATTDKQGLGA